MGKRRIVFSLLLVILLSACGSKSETVKTDKSEYKPYGKYEKPVEFTIGRGKRGMELMQKGDTIENNVASRYVESQSNIKTKVAWEVADTKQKISLAISTGDIPDVMVVDEETFKQLADNDLIADLTEVYKKSASKEVKARLDSYDTDVLKLSSIDGKLMAVPSAFFDYEYDVTWIRKDWVKKVGAQMPETKDELYNLAKLFVEKDVAGNGKTVGISSLSTFGGSFGTEFDLSPIFNSNYSFPKGWVKQKNGTIQYGSIQEETKNTLAELRNLYKEGTLDKQFAVRTDDDRKAILANQLGIHFGPFWTPQFNMQESVKNDSKADWVALAAPKNNEGKFVAAEPNPIIRYMVVRKGYEHPEAVIRSLNLNTDFTFGLTKEAKEYRRKELAKGTIFPWYYQTIDHKIDYYQANKKDYDSFAKAIKAKNGDSIPEHLVDAWNQYENYLKIGKKDTTGWGQAIFYTEGLKAATDPSVEKVKMGFYGKTKTMSTKWASLEKLEDETFLKIVMGKEPVSKFDDFVKEWKKLGGDTITKEVNEEAQKINEK